VLWWSVNSNLLKEYQNGYTPNPDILCNRQIKFDAFYKYALDKLDANAIATGHYACTTFGDFLENYDPSEGMQLLCLYRASWNGVSDVTVEN
jgi:tRNA-specific 2-thiouridylase